LERTQEGDELVLLSGTEPVEIIRCPGSFLAMTLNGVVERFAAAIVQEFCPGAHSPKRRRAHLLRGILRTVLDDAVTGAYVMQQKVAVRVNDFVAERIRHGGGSGRDSSARRSRGDRRNVAGCAADALEQVCTGNAVGRIGKG